MKNSTVAGTIGAALVTAIVLVSVYWRQSGQQPLPRPEAAYWHAPDINALPDDDSGRRIRYGQELIAHTAVYFGPAGKLAQISNGMNCQNCHLKAGTQTWGNNYAAVATTYPRFRARSGTVETVIKRINDCFIRSLNGTPPDSNSQEMQAMVAYIKWVGSNVHKGEKPRGTGIRDLAYMDRAADTLQGRTVYHTQCERCHGMHGEGLQDAANGIYVYPPLWGPHSYNAGAGMYRISRLAGYVKDNMPFGISFTQPALSDAEAWDVAAYINSQPRPHTDLRKDWPDIASKPADHPFGPYADSFTERQHKYGPFQPIAVAHKKG